LQGKIVLGFCLVVVILGAAFDSVAQITYPPRPPIAPGVRVPRSSGPTIAPGRMPTQPPTAPVPRSAPTVRRPVQGSGTAAEYAFRPDLDNRQYGECLQLEKTWKGLYNQYYQFYQYYRMMPPSDPKAAEMSYYLNSLKQQLDAVWRNFSSRCIYFPERR
jgi:hypothetical protein